MEKKLSDATTLANLGVVAVGTFAVIIKGLAPAR
jgi:hypothetical protein